MRYNKFKEAYEDIGSNQISSSKTGLKAKVKRFKFDIPNHSFLSNRYIINKVVLKDGD